MLMKGSVSFISIWVSVLSYHPDYSIPYCGMDGLVFTHAFSHYHQGVILGLRPPKPHSPHFFTLRVKKSLSWCQGPQKVSSILGGGGVQEQHILRHAPLMG
jgi:hypothetical protein